LGIAISYFIISIIQWNLQGLLPMSLYISIAWISLELSAFELLKTCFSYLQAMHTNQIKITKDEIDLCDNRISVISRFDELKSDVEPYSTFRTTLVERVDKLNKNISMLRLGKVIDGLSIAQIIMACIVVTITSLKKIPNDLRTNKIVSVMSLLAFSVLMINYYIKEKYDQTIKEYDLTTEKAKTMELYYLNVLKKIHTNNNKGENKE